MAEVKTTSATTKAKDDGKVDLFIPRDSGNSEPIFISLNGINYRLPRGKTSRVPQAIADIYQQMVEAQESFYTRHNSAD